MQNKAACWWREKKIKLADIDWVYTATYELKKAKNYEKNIN